MQRVFKTENGKWTFLCMSESHVGLPKELFGPLSDTEAEAVHLLAEHNKRRHNK